MTIEHDAAVALGDKLEIITHVHPAGIDRQVRSPNWPIALLQRSHMRSATRPKPSPALFAL